MKNKSIMSTIIKTNNAESIRGGLELWEGTAGGALAAGRQVRECLTRALCMKRLQRRKEHEEKGGSASAKGLWQEHLCIEDENRPVSEEQSRRWENQNHWYRGLCWVWGLAGNWFLLWMSRDA